MLKNILKNIGFIVSILAIITIFKKLNKKTETSIISEKASNALQDPEKRKTIKEAIETYHKTGNWEETEISSVL